MVATLATSQNPLVLKSLVFTTVVVRLNGLGLLGPL
jgi:hypothetical protein